MTIPKEMMLDLGTVGKGCAGDEAIRILRESGVSSASINLGGNVQTIGSKPNGSAWRIGLKEPTGEGNVGVLSVSDCAVVTSGNYEKYFITYDGTIYGHIMNPKTGYPADNDLLSVTIIAAEDKLCDALSTAMFVMGADSAEEYWRQNKDFDMILITENGEMRITEGIYDSFKIDGDHTNLSVKKIENQK